MNWFTNFGAVVVEAILKRFDAWMLARYRRRAFKHRIWLRNNGVIMPRVDGAHLPKQDYRRWSDQYMQSIRSARK